MSIRFCHTCMTSKPVEHFYPSLKTRCRQCAQVKAIEKRDQRVIYSAAWRSANPNAAKEWYEKNRQRKAEYNATYYVKNQEAERLRYRSWVAVSRFKKNALISKRRAVKANATVSWANQTKIVDVYELAAQLSQETGVLHQVDHIIPLQSKKVCGLHWEGNLRVITKEENLKKGNRLEGVPC